ncbi:MAG: glycosyltransferase family 4 protein, partial [Bacteroidetes bacterium]|nr:glycosyltransferase family 4 protein [Fibrella sp.]
ATGRITGIRKVPAQVKFLRVALFGYFIHPTVMGHTDWFRANVYHEHAGWVADYELWLRTVKTASFAVWPEPLLVYRVPVGYAKQVLATQQIRTLLARTDLPLTNMQRAGLRIYYGVKLLYFRGLLAMKVGFRPAEKAVNSTSDPSKPIRLVRLATVAQTLQVPLRGQLRFLAEQGVEVITASAGGGDVAGLPEQEACRHYPLPLTRQIRPLTDLWALWRTYRLLRQLRPDIVHSHTPKAGLIGMLAARLAGIPVRIHTITGLPLLEKRGWLRGLLVQVERLTYTCATAIWSDSYEILPLIAAAVTRRASQFTVLESGSLNGVDTARFTRTAALEQQANQLCQHQLTGCFVWVFVGRIVPDKGIAELLGSITDLYRLNPAVRLLLVGDREETLTPLPASVCRWLATHPAMIEVGFRADIRPYLAAADALVLPTYREGLPTVLLEAGAMDLPCVATDINGCREIIRHGYNGLLVPPKNQPALHTAMRELMENAPLRTALAGRARAHVVDRFRQEPLWRAVEAQYRQLIQAAP